MLNENLRIGVKLSATNLTVVLDGRTILDEVSFQSQPGELTAIIGPNGAGKTTLLRAISGERPTSGEILIDEESLYHSPEYWLSQIGYVPVDNILHDRLRVREALIYVGRLRLSSEPEKSIADKVDSLLTDYGFPEGDDRRQRFVRDLSSGERKRVNICAELLIDPPILLLDEPTSNLDPNAERDLMYKLRDLARQSNKTILVVTHTLNSIDACDQVIFVQNSIIQATGEPNTVLPQLESGIPDTNSHASDFYRWAAVFHHFRTRMRPSREKTSGSSSNDYAELGLTPITTPFWFQVKLLIQRYVRMQLNDRRVLIVTLLLGIFAGLFFMLVLPEKTFARPEERSDYSTHIVAARQAVFFLSIVVALIGLIYASKEISKEMGIYRHERLKGLSPLAYVLSKFIWLSLAVGLLTPVLILALLSTQQTDATLSLTAWVTVAITLSLTCVAAIALALGISSVSEKDNVVTNLLAFVVITQVLFSGLLTNERLEELINVLSVGATTRWAFEGVSSSWAFYCWAALKEFKEFDSLGHIISVWSVLAVYTITAIGLSALMLRLKDPWKRPGVLRSGHISSGTVILFAGAIIMLLSWAIFFRSLSQDYNSLTFSDSDYSGVRFARIEHVDSSNEMQHLMGLLGQSQCGDPNLK